MLHHRRLHLSRLAITPALALMLGGCLGLGGGSEPETTATTEAAGVTAAGAPAEGEIDVRRYLGPDYCPEIRIPEGFEVLRRYESGHDGEDGFVVWQASIGQTARECLYDGQGGLLLRVGVSGRVIAGPKGGPGDVTVPLRIIIEKYQEVGTRQPALRASDHHPRIDLDRFQQGLRV